MSRVPSTLRVAAVLSLVALLHGCATSPLSSGGDGPPAWEAGNRAIPPDAVPRDEPRSRYGNPTSYVVFGRRYHVMSSADGYVERGVASWYGSKFHGRRTSSGETYDMHAMTAAHKSLPLPTYVRVTNLRNGRTAVLKVNDRGPFHANRIIDLSYSAARKLDIVGQGTGLVEVRALTPGAAPPASTVVSAPTSAPAPVPASAPAVQAAPRAEPRMFLQAGAFAENANAERLRTRLASLSGVRAGVHEAVVGGQRLFRVRIGPLADVAEADRLSSRIVDAGMGLPRIVIE